MTNRTYHVFAKTGGAGSTGLGVHASQKEADQAIAAHKQERLEFRAKCVLSTEADNNIYIPEIESDSYTVDVIRTA